MKKIILLAAALILLGTAFLNAQESGKDRLSELEGQEVKENAGGHGKADSEVFSLSGLDHVNYGVHFTSGDYYDTRFLSSGEFSLNIVKMRLNPLPWAGLVAGIDFKTDYFRSREGRFYIYDDGSCRLLRAYNAGAYDKYYSSLRLLSFTAPLLLEFSVGKFSVGGGAELAYAFGGSACSFYASGRDETTNLTRGAKPAAFSCNVIGAVAYDGFTLYGKYYPKGNPYLPGLSYWTVGIGFDFL